MIGMNDSNVHLILNEIISDIYNKKINKPTMEDTRKIKSKILELNTELIVAILENDKKLVNEIRILINEQVNLYLNIK